VRLHVPDAVQSFEGMKEKVNKEAFKDEPDKQRKVKNTLKWRINVFAPKNHQSQRFLSAHVLRYSVRASELGTFYMKMSH
jgi:hypothetical protein